MAILTTLLILEIPGIAYQILTQRITSSLRSYSAPWLFLPGCFAMSFSEAGPMLPEITYAFVWVEDQIRVDAAVECGRRFEGITWILDPNSGNPALHIDNYLGIRGVQTILDRVKKGFPTPTT